MLFRQGWWEGITGPERKKKARRVAGAFEFVLDRADRLQVNSWLPSQHVAVLLSRPDKSGQGENALTVYQTDLSEWKSK